jgi:hypothetical protein
VACRQGIPRRTSNNCRAIPYPKTNAYVLERAELLHNAGFHRAAIQVANNIIERSDEQAPEDQAQLAAALEIGGRSLQALNQRESAREVFMRVASVRIGMG